MTRIKQSRLNSRRTRTRLRATPEGRHLQREMAAKGRTLTYVEPKPLRKILATALRRTKKDETS